MIDPHYLGSFAEHKLVTALINYMTRYDENKLEESLKELDTDCDGKISVEELEYFLKSWGDQLQHHEMKILTDLV